MKHAKNRVAPLLPTNRLTQCRKLNGWISALVLKASSEINFGFVCDLALYAFGFVVETATIHS